MELRSPAFDPGAEIPIRHTCEGKDLAPALTWRGVPAGAESLVLIVDDPDAPDPAAPRAPWVHWVLVDIPPQSMGLGEGGRPLPNRARESLNDWGRPGWGGPCPPAGRHRYRFRLHALDIALSVPAQPTCAQIEQAMHGHVLARAELIGTYAKQRR